MGGLSFWRPYRTQPDAFPRGWLDEVRAHILASPYLSATTLNQRFAGTQGFSVTFRRDGLPQLERHFPHFAGYVKQVICKQANAFFLNPLVIRKGAHVAAHIDCSLKSWTQPDRPPYPQKVSVLYLEVPADLVGGHLVLHRHKLLATVQPRTNMLVEFQGCLRHEVTAVESAADAARISLVCESYRLNRTLLERIPEFHVRTKRPFEDFLSQAMGPEEEEDPEERETEAAVESGGA